MNEINKNEIMTNFKRKRKQLVIFKLATSDSDFIPVVKC